MKLNSIKISPSEESIDPSFLISVEFSYENDVKVFYKATGSLRLNNRIVGSLIENRMQPDDYSFSNKEYNKGNRSIYSTTFLVPVSRLGLDMMENFRLQNKKNELILTVNLVMRALEPNFNVRRFTEGPFINQNVLVVEDSSMMRNKSYDFLNNELKISSADWLHDFSPIFNLGRYKVLEIPQLSLIPSNFNEDKEELITRINAAIESIGKMEEQISLGDWNGVMKESRPVWELVNNHDQITELLKESNYSHQATDQFQKTIRSLFDMSSKLIHRVNNGSKKEVMEESHAEQEDAMLVFYLSVSIINLLSRKVKRSQSYKLQS